MGRNWDIPNVIINIGEIHMGETKHFNSRKGNKKLSLLLVLRALELASDPEHPVKQIHLAKMVNDFGGEMNVDVWCDRKTVGRHLKQLVAAGYPVITVRGKGYYLKSNKLTRDECEIVVKILRESGLSPIRKQKIIAKLLAEQNYITK